jgi:two-component system, NtrC family, sensor kinase
LKKRKKIQSPGRGQNENNSETNGEDIRTYFKNLKFRLSVGLILAFILPQVIFAAFLDFKVNDSLTRVGKLNLEALARSQGDTIDLFLQERVVNIFSLFHGEGFSVTPGPAKMEFYLRKLRRSSDAFIDVGFLNSQGIQIAYLGPFPYLHQQNYRAEKWFQSLKNGRRNYHISDIYLGFRNKPHFTIAVKQMIGEKYYFMRATLDPDKFYTFLKHISDEEEVERALINEKGVIQLVDPEKGGVLEVAAHIPPLEEKSGNRALKTDDDTILMAHSWLKEARWALLVRQPLGIAHAGMRQARRVATLSLMALIFVIGIVIWKSTGRLIEKAKNNAEQREEMRRQLLHASKLASLGQLATGIAHEINNPLAVITATNGYIRDMLDPEIELESSPGKIIEGLDVIDEAAFRAKRITTQLLDFGRKNRPHLESCDINAMIEDLLGGVKKQEFRTKNIEIKRNFTPDLPKIPLDPDQIRQVFLNLINNAGDAIHEQGVISISTTKARDRIVIVIKDNGEGMDMERMGNIFDPFYTTKEVGKGTGLGLSVSLGIVKSMGGSLDVQSLKGSGTSFTISLPTNPIKGADNGKEKK